MSRRKKALFTTITATILQIVLLIINLILPHMIIKTYGSNVNGLINSITQFLGYIALLETGIGGVISALLYKALANNNEEEISKIIISTQSFFRKICVVLIIYIIGLCIFFPLFSKDEFKSAYTISLLCIIGISSFIQYYFGLTNQLLIKADQKGYIVNISKIITYIVSTIVMVVCIKFRCSIQLVKLIGTIILALSPLSYYIYVRKKYNIKYNLKKDDNILKQRWDGFAHQIASFIHTNTDIALLTIFSTMSEVSVYSVYLLITNGLRSFITILSNSLCSTFGNIYAKKEFDKLEKQFQIFDYLNIIVITFAFTIAAVSITPFIKIYTKGVTDANYNRLIFGFIMVLSEAFYCLRCSYSNIIFVVGDFKQTKWHAYLEGILNIVVSLFLIKPFGIIGIAIGTLIGMTTRWLLSIYYVNKEIINLNTKSLIKKYLVNAFAIIIFVIVFNNLKLSNSLSYASWVINAIVLSAILFVIILTLNCIFCGEDLKKMFDEYFGKVIGKIKWKRKKLV